MCGAYHFKYRLSITGKIERYRIFGKHGAEKVFGELFTDTINRLDFAKLYVPVKR